MSIRIFADVQPGKSEREKLEKTERFALLYSMSEDDGARTRNLRRDSPDTSCSKSNAAKDVTSPRPSERTTGRTSKSEGGVLDADLAAIVTAWPTLPEHIRAAIVALTQTSTKGGGR